MAFPPRQGAEADDRSIQNIDAFNRLMVSTATRIYIGQDFYNAGQRKGSSASNGLHSSKKTELQQN
jgi:hypothetical protein